MQNGDTPPRLVLIGGDSDAFNQFLASDDPCFGRCYAASAPECKVCTAAVISDGQVFLLNEVCRDRTQAAKLSRPAPKVARINRIPSREVMRRLEARVPVLSIFLEVLGQADIDIAGRDARTYLCNMLYYLKQTYHIPVPDVPRVKELKEQAEKHAHDQGGSADRRGAPGAEPSGQVQDDPRAPLPGGSGTIRVRRAAG